MKVLKFSEQYFTSIGMFWPEKMDWRQKAWKMITNFIFLSNPILISTSVLLAFYRNPYHSFFEVFVTLQNLAGSMCQGGVYLSVISNIQIVRQLHEKLQLIVDNCKLNTLLSQFQVLFLHFGLRFV